MAGVFTRNGVKRLSGSMYNGVERWQAGKINGTANGTWVLCSTGFATSYSIDDGLTWTVPVEESFTTAPRGGTWLKLTDGADNWMAGLDTTSAAMAWNVGLVPTGAWTKSTPVSGIGEPARKGSFVRVANGDYHALYSFDDEDIIYSDANVSDTFVPTSNWTKQTDLDVANRDISSYKLGKAANGSDLFYAVGAEDATYNASIGGAWTRDTGAGMSGQFIRDIHYGDGYWVLVGQSNNIKYSNAVNNWTSATMDGLTASEWNGIIYSKRDKLWVACADAGYIGVCSGSVPSHFNVQQVGSVSLEVVRHKAGTWIIAGTNGTILRSTNGKDWVVIADPGFDSKDIFGVLVDTIYNNSLDRG